MIQLFEILCHLYLIELGPKKFAKLVAVILYQTKEK